MTYIQWFDAHALKHKKIIEKLLAPQGHLLANAQGTSGKSKEEIIEYFRFENMVKSEPNFCLLYAENKKCHDIAYLSCYLCACPHFRFNDKGVKEVEKKMQKSFCAIDSKEGAQSFYGDTIHQDCSNCHIPHAKSYVEKNFDLDCKRIMRYSIVNPAHSI